MIALANINERNNAIFNVQIRSSIDNSNQGPGDKSAHSPIGYLESRLYDQSAELGMKVV